MMVRSKTRNAAFMAAFLMLFLTPSFSSTNLIYDGDVPDHVHEVLGSHGLTTLYLDSIEALALSFGMPSTVAFTRLASVVVGVKTHSALKRLDEASLDNLSLSLLKQGGELCCLSLETFCAVGYWWTGESMFFVGTVTLMGLRNAVGLIYN